MAASEDAEVDSSSPEVVMIVDIANVMGSRPDGWWRDRAGAATRLLGLLEQARGRDVALPDTSGTSGRAHLSEVVAVLEGAARSAEGPEAVSVRRAARDGDSEIVEETQRQTAAGRASLVVTADRGLRARLPPGALVAGPGWLNQLLGW